MLKRNTCKLVSKSEYILEKELHCDLKVTFSDKHPSIQISRIIYKFSEQQGILPVFLQAFSNWSTFSHQHHYTAAILDFQLYKIFAKLDHYSVFWHFNGDLHDRMDRMKEANDHLFVVEVDVSCWHDQIRQAVSTVNTFHYALS